MKLIVVRHGHPDYEKDCLTELGHNQAEAAAKRLESVHFDKLFSSSMGRAYETALHIAKNRESEVEKLDFIREISTGPISTPRPENYNFWTLVSDYVRNGNSVMDEKWYEKMPFSDNKVVDSFYKLAKASDEFLASLGYVRENDYYRVAEPQYKNVLLACHAGASSCLFARFFNLPLPFVISSFSLDFTNITVIDFSGQKGELIAPKFKVAVDARHIEKI